MEDPNPHLSVFLEVFDNLKLNEVSTDAILFRFSFSLKDIAQAWLYSWPPGSITT